MQAHFFDIDTLIVSDAKVWIVDKSKPSQCILRISTSDFNLVRKGVYREQGNKVSFAGNDYFMPDSMMNDVKIKCKVMKADSSNLAFSMREFQDSELINNSNHKVDIDAVIHLKNTQDDVYIICSKNIKNAYEKVIDKLEEKLGELGISPKKYYFISETFYERDEDETSFDKVRLLLQHMVGFKTKGRLFTDEQIDRYDRVFFYDEDQVTTQLALSVSDAFVVMIGNSEDSVKKQVRGVVEQNSPELVVNLVTTNKVRKFVTNSVSLEFTKLIKSFESFRFFY